MKPQNENALIVYKENNFNQANFQELGLNCYQVFLHLISKIKGYENFTNQEEVGKISLLAVEFQEVFNVSNKLCYDILKRAVDKLLNKHVILNLDDRVRKINICSYADYIKNRGKIEVKFTNEILPFLTQVKTNFLTYRLKEIASFTSIYTTRLYEILTQYKSTGWFILSIDRLRTVFGIEKKFQSYFYLKKRTFAKAHEEINQKYPDLKLSFSEIKKGRKVVKIRFEFTPPGAQNLQEAPIEQITHSQEIPVSDDKLVQANFVEISPITKPQSAKEVKKYKRDNFVKNTLQTPQKEKEKIPSPKKSLWKKIRSFLL